MPASLSVIRKQLISSAPGCGEVSPKFSRPHRLKRLMAHGAVSAALMATWAAAPAQALTWNWSFDGGPLPSAQGTFTTAGSTAQANTLETITGITGTYTDLGGISRTITGLGTLGGASNEFQWDGSNASPILTDDEGISFILDTLEEVNIYYASPVGFGNVNRFATTSTSPNSVSSSLLSPVQAPSSVPGPLPLFGAAAAFGWSRQLRRRIKTAA